MECNVSGPSYALLKRRMYFVLGYRGEERILREKLSDVFVTLRMVSNLTFTASK